MNATQRSLFSRKPDTLTGFVPDLASGPPTISPDGETVTVHIRHGVRFSPPSEREVTSADVAYAIERGANPHVANPYFTSYFSGLRGAAHTHGGRFPGITTPNLYTIVFHLIGHSHTRILVDALALPITAPVPESYAKKYDAANPSRYGDYQVATGPYMFESNSRGRVLGVGYRPSRYARLVRNRGWKQSTDFRPAYLNAIEVRIARGSDAAGEKVLAGSHLAESGPPAAVVQLAHERFPSQLHMSPSAGIEYIALNNKSGPFSNSDVRKALWAALNREAMNRAAGRELTSHVATHFLYPGFPGFRQAQLYLSARKLGYNEHPNGDLALAQRYMEHAGYERGHFRGRRALSVVGVAGERSAQMAAIAIDTLHGLGFKTSLRLVSPQAMYASYCGVPAREIDVCLNAKPTVDFADGQLLLDATFDGPAIRPTQNQNWGQVNDPDLNSAIEREARLLENLDREQGWGAVDNGLVGHAVAIPYAWIGEAAIESKDVDGVGDLWNAGALDYSFTSLK